MRFGRITIHNFFRVKHLVIDLSTKGITLIEGRNGVGKTTIFTALSWCIHGKYPSAVGRIGDEIVNPTAKHDCYVELEALDVFDKGDKVITKRTRMEGAKHKEANLYVSYRGKRTEVEKEKIFDQARKDISDSTAYISEIFGMDYETFTKQALFAQEGIDPVTRMKDTALKTFMLESVLHIDWAHRCLERAKDEKKRLDTHIENRQHARLSAQKTMALHCSRLEEYGQKSGNWRKNEAERKSGIREELADAVALKKDAKKSNSKIEKDLQRVGKDFDKKLSAFQKKLSCLLTPQDFDKEIERLEKEYRQSSVEESRLLDAEKRAADKIGSLEGRVKEAANQVGERCESCGTIITKKHLPFMVQEYRAEIEAKRGEMLRHGIILGEIKTRSESILQSLEAIKEKREAQKDVTEERANLRVEIIKLEGEKREKIAELKEGLFDLEDIEEEIEKLSGELDKKGEDPFESLITREKEDLKKIASESRLKRHEIQDLRKELEIVEFWIKGFSAGGLQSYLLEGITPIINKRIAYYLMNLSDGRIAARLHTVKKLKSGDYREDFHVEVNSMEGGPTFASLSGGEKKRVDIAVALAVADFQRSLSHKNLEFLVLDEVLAMVDSVWERKFYELIKKEFSNYSTYVISHKNLEEELYDYRWEVVKINGETRLSA